MSAEAAGATRALLNRALNDIETRATKLFDEAWNAFVALPETGPHFTAIDPSIFSVSVKTGQALPPMVEVTSSNINSVGKREDYLYVMFKNLTTYVYELDSVEDAANASDMLIAADELGMSVGKIFNMMKVTLKGKPYGFIKP